MSQLKQIAKDFHDSGQATLGIIVKTNHKAEELYAELAETLELQLISPKSQSFHNGISVVSVQMSKGLEFDHVVIADANAKSYSQDADRGLLYIACTRAMHQLSLLYDTELSSLITLPTDN